MRRATPAAEPAAPLCVQSANAENAATYLIERASGKNAAFMRGDMERWSELVRIAPDFTLMQPFGGPASHGFDTSPERLWRNAQGTSKTARPSWKWYKLMCQRESPFWS
jgi:hypothetical protein